MVRQAAEFAPVAAVIERNTGQRPHPSTCTRWTRHGVGGIKLKVKMVGGRPLTCDEWFDSFCDARTAAAGLSDDAGISAGE